MTLPPTTLLILCLLAATLLGLGAGACLWHLRLARRHEDALSALRESAERERHSFGVVLAREREKGATRHREACRQIARERGKARRAMARYEALAAHVGEQGASAGSLRMNGRERETRQPKSLHGVAESRGRYRPDPAEALDDERLPVLNRRVAGVSPPPMFPIGEDLDIPTLAESELPDADGDLEMELLDTGDPLRGIDER